MVLVDTSIIIDFINNNKYKEEFIKLLGNKKISTTEIIIMEVLQQNKEIILFINGMPLKNIKPIADAIDARKVGLRFFIDRSDETIAFWNHLTISRESTGIFTRKVSVSVGIEDQNPIPTLVMGDKSYTLILAREKWFSLSVFIILALLVLFIVLAVKKCEGINAFV